MKNIGKVWFFLMMLFLFSSACSLERSLDNFSQTVEETKYGVFWSGYIVYNQDSLYFDILGDVGYRMSDSARDVIIIKLESGDLYVATREMADPLNRPAPNKEKMMTQWKIAGEKSLFANKIRELRKNGEIIFKNLPQNQDSASKKLIYLYGLKPELAQRKIKQAKDLFK
ncbi:MAG: hypothetical protein K9M44_01755 [Candidatus Pacebacteria bacterium]|nr:hypothetical protein [Candidatus Paceibacterota bacterium]